MKGNTINYFRHYAAHTTVIKVETYRDKIIDVLTGPHHDRISPLPLTPHQLLMEPQTIKAHIAPSRVNEK